jgi:hypothetical protein
MGTELVAFGKARLPGKSPLHPVFAGGDPRGLVGLPSVSAERWK